MNNDPRGVDDEAAREWLAERKVIATALVEWEMATSLDQGEQYAAAIIARLAQHDPPIVANFVGTTAKRIFARIRQLGIEVYKLPNLFGEVADTIESEEV